MGISQSLRTPRPQGAKYLRAGQWAEWFVRAAAGTAPIQVSREGAQDLARVLKAAEAVLAIAKQQSGPMAPALSPQPMTMQTLRVPPGKRRPKFAADVPLAIRRDIWRQWLLQHAGSERPYLPVSRIGANELAELLESAA